MMLVRDRRKGKEEEVGAGGCLPVKRMGKMRINQMDVPRVPWRDAMPRRATSVEVSNPRPNITPRGYIFHALLHYALR